MDTLNRRRELYVQARVLGFPMERAAEDAQLTVKQARNFEHTPQFEVMAKSAVIKADDEFKFTLDDVLKGLKEAIDQASKIADPQAAIAGWREVARIMGYYAPEKRELHLTAEGHLTITSMRALSDDELLGLAQRGVKVIDGECQDVRTPQQKPALLAARSSTP